MRTKIFILAGFLLALAATGVRATAPVGGQTLAFDTSSSGVGDTTATVDALAAADFDNDGDPDALSGDAGGGLTQWTNTGGSWTSSVISATGSSIQALTAADFDNDGDFDALSGDANGALTLWTNTGGSWSNTALGTVGSSIQTLTATDFDNDGDPDALSGDANGVLTLWTNTGGSWVSSTISTTGSAIQALAAADFDRDGDLDALSGDAAGALTLWENTGSGWSAAALGSAPAPVASLGAADFDGDGNPDVLSGSGDASGTLSIWQNNGSPFGGGWSSAAAGTAGAPVNALALGDFDRDGDADFLSGDSSGALQGWQNNGSPFDGTWASLSVVSGTQAVEALAALDADGDGDLDALSGHALDAAAAEVRLWENARTHPAAIFPNSGNGAGSTGGNTVYGLDAADLDGDGLPDLASAEVGGTLRVWRNDGTPFEGTWSGQSAGSTPSGEWLLAVAAGDVDKDGDPDLVTGNTGGAVRLWENDGTPFNGTWAQTVVGATNGGANAVALGDLDNDGDLDIVSGHSIGATAEVIAWRNDGGTWTRFDVGTHDADMNTVVLADLDGDGDLDIASSSTTSAANGEIIVWQNNGLGNTWTRQDAGEVGVLVYALGAADLDGDGDPDLVSGDGNFDVIAWQNNGTPFAGTWVSQTLGSGSRTMRGLRIADWDADGWPDVLTGEGNGNAGGALRVWHNDGTPFDGAWPATQIADTGDNPNTLPAADLDGDGDLDFGVGFSSDTDVPYEVSVWANIGGQATFTVTDTSPGSPIFIPNSTEDDVLRVVLAHNGVSGEASAEWAQAAFTLYRSDCATPLTSAEANAFIDALRVRRDDGDDAFESDGSDPLIGEVASLTLDANGVQSLAFTDGDGNAQAGAGGSAVFWVSVLATADADQQSPNNFCLEFDPDADALVEGKYPSGDAGMSLADSAPVNTGNTPTAVTLQSFSAHSVPRAPGNRAGSLGLLTLLGAALLFRWSGSQVVR